MLLQFELTYVLRLGTISFTSDATDLSFCTWIHSNPTSIIFSMLMVSLFIPLLQISAGLCRDHMPYALRHTELFSIVKGAKSRSNKGNVLYNQGRQE